MKSLQLLLCFLLVTVNFTNAQRMFGIANSNYAGVNSLFINPANVSDSRLKADVNLFSGNSLFNQNYGKIKTLSFLNDYDFVKSTNIKNAGIDFLGEARLPSFMFQLNKKSGIGLTIRSRGMGSARKFSSDFLNIFENSIDESNLGNGSILSAGKASFDLHGFSEIGVTYGQEIYNTGRHFIKAGATIKKYFGIGFSSASFNDLSITLVDTAAGIKKAVINGSLKVSSNISNGNPAFDDFQPKDIFSNNGSGFGLDLGAVYELRDDDPISDKRYDNKYKLKIGFSITDFGFIKYKASPYVENYVINTNGPKTVTRYDTANIYFDDVITYFKSIPGVTATLDKNAVSTKAPMAFIVFADYKLKEHIYLNGLITGSLLGHNSFGVKQALQLTVTPRYESKLFDAGLPISFNALSKDLKVGLGLRLAFLYFGSDDLGGVVSKNSFKGGNMYMGVRVGFPYKPKKVKEVEEPEVVVPTKPKVIDTDKDGILDNVDKCPTVAGKAEYNGCPDTDGDGIQDSEDNCPTVAGLKQFNGCPDADGDGVPDSEDECQTVAGLKQFKGCPDTDGDGVPDKDDKCIDKAGPIENAGCPKITEQVTKRLNFASQAIQFEVGKAVIRQVSFTQLDEVVKILNEYTDYNLTVAGHTDNSGTIGKNQILSEQRAAAIKTYFVSKGFDAARIETAGYGDTKPLMPNTNAKNKAINRRVELNLKLKE